MAEIGPNDRQVGAHALLAGATFAGPVPWKPDRRVNGTRFSGFARERPAIVRDVRIASLVPSATEMLFALGLGDDVVAVTHECDYPAEATTRPRLTRSVLPGGLTPAEIDAAVREVVGRGDALYELDEPLLRDLDVELIVTQAVCSVCAVSYDDVRSVADRLPSAPLVLSLDPATLHDVLADTERLALAANAPVAGASLHRDLESRLVSVRSTVGSVFDRPRVLALEWLDPPFIAGHWVPEMLALAGGEDVMRTGPGTKSRTVSWEELATTEPDIVVVMPCGYDADQAAKEATAYSEHLAGLGANDVYAVDAAASFSRPGPRLVDGVELLAHLFQPDRAGTPGVAYRDVNPAMRRP
jgi:iron complex transport system substrate-binding protein